MAAGGPGGRREGTGRPQQQPPDRPADGEQHPPDHAPMLAPAVGPQLRRPIPCLRTAAGGSCMIVNIFRFARCADGRGSLSRLFFSDDPYDLARAKAICSRCRAARRASPGRSSGPSRGACGAARSSSTVPSSPSSGVAAARRCTLAPPSSSTRSPTSPDLGSQAFSVVTSDAISRQNAGDAADVTRKRA